MIRILLFVNVLVILGIVWAVAFLPETEAHHKSNHGKGPAPSLSASFQVTPDPVIAHSLMFIEGFDFKPNEQVQVIIQPVWCCLWARLIADPNGKISFSTNASGAGSYQLCGMVGFDKRKPEKETPCGVKFPGQLVAFLEFDVVISN